VPQTRTRPLDRIDAAVLLVAAAVAGPLAVRNDHEAAGIFTPDSVEWIGRVGSPGRQWALLGVHRLGLDLAVILAVATLGLGLIAARRPRPFRPGRWPTPGVAAIAVAAPATAVKLAGAVSRLSESGYRIHRDHAVFYTFIGSSSFPKSAVLGAWAVLLVAGRWRREAGWIGRAGLVLGWAWLATFACDLFQAAFW